MTSSNEKIRALFLAAIMFTSVLVVFISFSGAAAARTFDRGNTGGATPQYNTANGTGPVGDGAVIFQGEEGIDLVDTSGGSISAATFERTAGSAEGDTLQINPVPTDQDTGTYASSAGDVNITVQQPRVTTLEVQNDDGNDVAGGSLRADQGSSVVFVEYNYEDAEDIEVTVEDENGLDVTGEIVDGSESREGDGNIGITPDNVDAGDYTFTVAGVEDLDGDQPSESTTVTITTQDDAQVSLDSDQLTQGENLGYTVDNSNEGEFHGIFIESNEFRDNRDASEYAGIFRETGDVVQTGVINTDTNSVFNSSTDSGLASQDKDSLDYAFAIVEIDDGDGVGDVETKALDDSTIDIELAPQNDSSIQYLDTSQNHIAGEDLTALDSDDDDDFDVEEGDVQIDNPTGTYVVNSEVTLNGTAAEGVEDVVFYARDNNDFELVEVDGSNSTDVEADDTFEVEDVSLSEGTGSGNNILSFAGTYRLGVIEQSAVNGTGSAGPDDIKTDVETGNFNSNISGTVGLRVVDTALEANFRTYNGQIADEDSVIDVNGTAIGKSSTGVVVAFVGERGNAEAQVVSVDSDGTFDEDDLDLSSINQGAATAHVISSGRDNTFGDQFADEDGLVSEIEDNFTGSTASGDQVRSRIVANTVDDTGSDDLIVTENFRLNDALTSIENAAPEDAPDADTAETGEVVAVEGTTNKRPDDNVITVEILDQDDESVTLTSTDTWGTDGQWSVTFQETGDIEPGTYTVEADDGDSTDRVPLEIVADRQVETPTPTPEPDTPTPEPDTPTATPEPDTPTPGSEGPGFGLVVAVVALLAAALLAVRRRS